VLFDSPPYFLFLIIVVLVYWRLRHDDQNVFLLVASYLFYAWWDWRFLALMVGSTSVDYLIARKIAPGCGGRRKAWLVCSLVVNFSVLGVFKYFNFFADSLATALTVLGMHDIPLPLIIDEFKKRKATAIFLSVRPNTSFHFVRRDADGRVTSVDDVVKANAWINGGFFVFSREIFNYIRPGEELVEQPFQRLIDAGKLYAFEYDGFWRCIDTFKDLQALENLLTRGGAPWMVWRTKDAP